MRRQQDRATQANDSPSSELQKKRRSSPILRVVFEAECKSFSRAIPFRRNASKEMCEAHIASFRPSGALKAFETRVPSGFHLESKVLRACAMMGRNEVVLDTKNGDGAS